MHFPLLEKALDEAAAQGHRIDFWWRDDDAIEPTPALDRLLAMASEHAAPVAVAAIPAFVQPALTSRLAREPLASVLVHGLTHENHAPMGSKKAEFGSHRPLEMLKSDATEALRLARAQFGEALCPAFVPPWNRIDSALAHDLPKIGYTGLSTFGPRKAIAGTEHCRLSSKLEKTPPLDFDAFSSGDAVPTLLEENAPERVPITWNLAVANTHIDPIDWHGTRGLVAVEGVDEQAARAVKRGDSFAGEPIGLLTHHLVHTDDVWRACRALLALLAAHPVARFVRAETLFTKAVR